MEIELNTQEQRRRGEAGRAPFRSGRFFSASGKWFFATREGKNHGPFESRQEAEHELTLFLRGLAGCTDFRSAHDPWGSGR